MEYDTLVNIAAAIALVGLMAYALLGGADFGGGVWDLFATGSRRNVQRQAIARAMGPVWEANHVWLIFVIVVLFTCFPRGYAPLATAMFIPFHLALVGIMLRGAAFVFRGYLSRPVGRSAGEPPGFWELSFGISSVISPLLLGAAFGAVTAGGIQVTADGTVLTTWPPAWLRPYSLGCGVLALSTCAYLAAVYLTVETEGELREDFRLRAIIAGTATAGLALVVLVLAWRQAPWFFEQLTRPRAWPVLVAGLFFFAASAWAVFSRRYKLSRVFAAAEVVCLLTGWGLAQHPYFCYPDLTLMGSAGPQATIKFLLGALPVGGVVLVPSLWLLFHIFKATSRPVSG